ncbi:50S ribosomal protein L24 [Candidatus Woesearchaeota archaeon]|nr:50S ribosomal protein L24P [uncultured archaeon]MBS3150607.1 50S ribosomal protein L24 [Candidatus Woesearchaeota archaeon]
MKQKFSTSWKKSAQPRKKRKYIANAPLHIKRKFISSHLSKELIKKYLRRSIPLIKGDKVKVARGIFRGKTGKIEKVFTKKTKVYIENCQKTKNDGTKVYCPVHPSNLIITELNLTDKKRKEKLEKKNG